MRTQSGFTFIEAMITVTIIGILAAIAVPMYNEYITRSQLVEAHSNLGQYRIAMEQHYQDNRNYKGTGLDGCGAAEPAKTNFTYTCVLGKADQAYVATATGNATSRAKDFVFTINERNERKTTGAPSLWQPVPFPADCFVTRKKGC